MTRYAVREKPAAVLLHFLHGTCLLMGIFPQRESGKVEYRSQIRVTDPDMPTFTMALRLSGHRYSPLEYLMSALWT